MGTRGMPAGQSPPKFGRPCVGPEQFSPATRPRCLDCRWTREKQSCLARALQRFYVVWWWHGLSFRHVSVMYYIRAATATRTRTKRTWQDQQDINTSNKSNPSSNSSNNKNKNNSKDQNKGRIRRGGGRRRRRRRGRRRRRRRRKKEERKKERKEGRKKDRKKDNLLLKQHVPKSPEPGTSSWRPSSVQRKPSI